MECAYVKYICFELIDSFYWNHITLIHIECIAGSNAFHFQSYQHSIDL